MNRYELDETQAAWRERDPVPPHQDWSPLEHSIWTRLRAGEIANLDRYPDAAGPREFDPKDFDPERDGWRRVSARFLEMVLLDEPWRSAVHRGGVRILGAWFGEEIDLNDTVLIRPLWLHRCRIAAGLWLTDATCRLLSFDESRVEGALVLERADVSGLFLRQAAIQQIIACRLKVKDQLSLARSRVGLARRRDAGILDLERADIGRDLFMGDEATFRKINCRGLKVGGQLDLVEIRVEGTLNLWGADIGESLFVRGAELGGLAEPVDAAFARIGGNLDLRCS